MRSSDFGTAIEDQGDPFAATASLVNDRFGAARFGYIVDFPASLDAKPILRLNHPPAWIEHFLKERQFVEDPMMRHARTARAAFDWCDADWTTRVGKLIAGNAADFGMSTNGFTVPIPMANGGRAFIVFGTDMPASEWHRFLRERQAALELIAYKLHHVQLMHGGGDEAADALAISERERETMAWVGAGKSDEDVATILGITERTVRAHLVSARQKLDATNRTHLIAKGIAFGLIDPV